MINDKQNLQEIFKVESEKAGINNIEYVNGNYGKAYIDNKNIRIPNIKTLKTLATALHEIGHIVIGKVKPKYYEEFLCEMFVRQKFKEYGLTLKRSIVNQQKLYIAYRVRLSIKRAKSKSYKVKPEVLQFIGLKHKEIKNLDKYGISIVIKKEVVNNE
jgi:hypothetical protein